MRNGGSIITYAACKHCLRELVVEKMMTLLGTLLTKMVTVMTRPVASRQPNRRSHATPSIMFPSHATEILLRCLNSFAYYLHECFIIYC